MRVRPSGVTPPSRLRNFARTSVVKLPKVSRAACSWSACDVVRVAVPDAADRDAGDEVDVGVAVLVEDAAALAPRHGEARVEREGLEARRHVALLELDDRLRPRPDLDAALDFRHVDSPVIVSAPAAARTRENRAARRAAILRGRDRAEEREARPRVQVDDGDAAVRRDDRVAAVDLQAERRRGAARRERPARPGRTEWLREVLVAVVEPLEPGRTVVVLRQSRHAVELDEVAGDVVLHDRVQRFRARAAARGSSSSAAGEPANETSPASVACTSPRLTQQAPRKRAAPPPPSVATRSALREAARRDGRRARSCARGRCSGWPRGG